MNINPKAFVSSLTPEQAKDFLMTYFKAAPEEQEHILELDGLKHLMTKFKDVIDKRLLVRENSFIISAGQTSVNSGLAELGDFNELYLNGRRVYPGVHYTVIKESGVINLTFTPEYDMNAYFTDCKANTKLHLANADTLQGFGLDAFITKNNFTEEVMKLRKYEEITVRGGQATVQSRFQPLSGRPSVIINGSFAVLGKDYELTDREHGILTIKNPPTKEYLVVINDMVFASGEDISNAQTLNGLKATSFVRGERIFEFDTLGSAQSATYLATDDKVRVWGNTKLGDTYVSHYLVIHDEESDSIRLTNGLFLRPLTFITTSETGVVEPRATTYKVKKLRKVTQYSEVYIGGVYKSYGRDWTVDSSDERTIRLINYSAASQADITIVNRTDTQKVDITTLGDKTAEDFVVGRREFSFTTKESLLEFLDFQIDDRVSLWGEKAIGDQSLRNYIIVRENDNMPSTLAVSNGLFAKEILQPTVKVYEGGNIPLAWFNTGNGTLDMHGYTHGNIGSEFNMVKPFTIKRIINAPKVSNIHITFSGCTQSITVDSNTGSASMGDKNILSNQAITLKNNGMLHLYRSTEADGRTMVLNHFVGS